MEAVCFVKDDLLRLCKLLFFRLRVISCGFVDRLSILGLGNDPLTYTKSHEQIIIDGRFQRPAQLSKMIGLQVSD